MEKHYTVSYDTKSQLWYAHHKKMENTPISGSLSKDKKISMEYAKMYNFLPNNVAEIEARRKKEFEKWLGAE